MSSWYIVLKDHTLERFSNLSKESVKRGELLLCEPVKKGKLSTKKRLTNYQLSEEIVLKLTHDDFLWLLPIPFENTRYEMLTEKRKVWNQRHKIKHGTLLRVYIPKFELVFYARVREIVESEKKGKMIQVKVDLHGDDNIYPITIGEVLEICEEQESSGNDKRFRINDRVVSSFNWKHGYIEAFVDVLDDETSQGSAKVIYDDQPSEIVSLQFLISEQDYNCGRQAESDLNQAAATATAIEKQRTYTNDDSGTKWIKLLDDTSIWIAENMKETPKVLAFLYRKGIITNNQRKEIEKYPEKQQAFDVIDEVKTMALRGREAFLSALEATGNSEIYGVLTKQEKLTREDYPQEISVMTNKAEEKIPSTYNPLVFLGPLWSGSSQATPISEDNGSSTDLATGANAMDWWGSKEEAFKVYKEPYKMAELKRQGRKARSKRTEIGEPSACGKSIYSQTMYKQPKSVPKFEVSPFTADHEKLLKREIKERTLPSKDVQVSANSDCNKNIANTEYPKEVPDHLVPGNLVRGAKVKIHITGSAEYGSIRWIGYLKAGKSLMAGLEMENDVGYTDGMFKKQRLFETSSKRGIITNYEHCEADGRDPSETTKTTICFSSTQWLSLLEDSSVWISENMINVQDVLSRLNKEGIISDCHMREIEKGPIQQQVFDIIDEVKKMALKGREALLCILQVTGNYAIFEKLQKLEKVTGRETSPLHSTNDTQASVEKTMTKDITANPRDSIFDEEEIHPNVLSEPMKIKSDEPEQIKPCAGDMKGAGDMDKEEIKRTISAPFRELLDEFSNTLNCEGFADDTVKTLKQHGFDSYEKLDLLYGKPPEIEKLGLLLAHKLQLEAYLEKRRRQSLECKLLAEQEASESDACKNADVGQVFIEDTNTKVTSYTDDQYQYHEHSEHETTGFQRSFDLTHDICETEIFHSQSPQKVLSSPEMTCCKILASNIAIGDRVKVLGFKDAIGKVKWIGRLTKSYNVIAGLEMESDIENGNNGVFKGRQLFDCEQGRGKFMPLQKCMKIASEYPSNTPAAVGSPVSLETENFPKGFALGNVVEMTHKGKNCRGNLRWVGYMKNPTKLIAGIEVREDIEGGSDGKLKGCQLFKCPINRGLFISLANCRKVKE